MADKSLDCEVKTELIVFILLSKFWIASGNPGHNDNTRLMPNGEARIFSELRENYGYVGVPRESVQRFRCPTIIRLTGSMGAR
jgi:hypothetical protein